MSERTCVHIPVVDFAEFCITKNADDVSEQVLRKLAEEICNAFSKVGFVCLRNHGVAAEKLDALVGEARTFFRLPELTKTKYSRPLNGNGGWVCNERERLNPDRPGDLKEAFNIGPESQMAHLLPDQEVPGFRPAAHQFADECWSLAQRVLLLIGLGLGLKNASYFCELHHKSSDTNSTTLRCLFYPPMQPDAGVKPKQIRCGEHSDYGSITLVFQDDVGGLELRRKDGEFVAATPMADTVLVNIGDVMERWTSNQLMSTKHRVVIPETEIGRERPRMSVVYFMHPDDDCVIQCIDGSNKYEPITSLDYLNMRFQETYAKK